jgi:hypothetical protein
MSGDGQGCIGPGAGLLHRHLLQEALAVAGFQAQLAELLDHVGNGLLLAGRAGLAALELIGRQHPDMLAKRGLVDVGGWRRHLRRGGAGSSKARPAPPEQPNDPEFAWYRPLLDQLLRGQYRKTTQPRQAAVAKCAQPRHGRAFTCPRKLPALAAVKQAKAAKLPRAAAFRA